MNNKNRPQPVLIGLKKSKKQRPQQQHVTTGVQIRNSKNSVIIQKYQYKYHEQQQNISSISKQNNSTISQSKSVQNNNIDYANTIDQQLLEYEQMVKHYKNNVERLKLLIQRETEILEKNKSSCEQEQKILNQIEEVDKKLNSVQIHIDINNIQICVCQKHKDKKAKIIERLQEELAEYEAERDELLEERKTLENKQASFFIPMNYLNDSYKYNQIHLAKFSFEERIIALQEYIRNIDVNILDENNNVKINNTKNIYTNNDFVRLLNSYSDGRIYYNNTTSSRLKEAMAYKSQIFCTLFAKSIMYIYNDIQNSKEYDLPVTQEFFAFEQYLCTISTQENIEKSCLYEEKCGKLIFLFNQLDIEQQRNVLLGNNMLLKNIIYTIDKEKTEHIKQYIFTNNSKDKVFKIVKNEIDIYNGEIKNLKFAMTKINSINKKLQNQNEMNRINNNNDINFIKKIVLIQNIVDLKIDLNKVVLRSPCVKYGRNDKQNKYRTVVYENIDIYGNQQNSTIHHKDLDSRNPSLNNLVVLEQNLHSAIHKMIEYQNYKIFDLIGKNKLGELKQIATNMQQCKEEFNNIINKQQNKNINDNNQLTKSDISTPRTYSASSFEYTI